MSPTPSEAEVARHFAAQHEAVARRAGKVYAEMLFTELAGKEPTREWFSARCQHFGRSFGDFYAPRLGRDGIDQCFVRHMLDQACRAMFSRLAELTTQAPAEQGRAH